MRVSQVDGLPPVGASICTITPEDVARWSSEGRMDNNFRTINPPRVALYAGDMSSGRWKMNAESVKFNRDGAVVDGQHRLRACLEAGVSFDTMVYRGNLDTTAVDTGQRRTLAQQLRHRGYKNVAIVASVAVLVDLHNRVGNIRAGGTANRGSSLTGLLDLVEQNRDRFLASAHATHKLRRSIPGSLVGFIWYEGSKVSEEAATEFLTQACRGCTTDGDGLPAGNPAFLFYRYMTNHNASKKVATNVMRANMITAANAWAARSELKMLRWSELTPTGKRSVFPSLTWYGDLRDWEGG